MQTFIFIKPLTMRLCSLCKIVSMSKQYSGTVGLRTKINLATRYYIIKGSFKGQANRKPSGIFSGTSAASLIYHFLQENLNFWSCGMMTFCFPLVRCTDTAHWEECRKNDRKKKYFSNISCMFLNSDNVLQFKFYLF